jgi:hypothetical protein
MSDYRGKALMRLILRLTTPALAIVAVGCGREKPPPDQNIIVADNNNMAGAEVETLPSDESSGTPSNQLVNGNDNPDVNEAAGNTD